MQKDIKVGIYCIENLTTNKKYIGQSINIYDRYRRHKNELKHGNHDNDYLQRSWNKYGENDFKFYILECCKDTELDAKEIYYINLYNTLDRDYGYNLKSGGQNGGSKVLDEVKAKISEAVKESYINNDGLINKRKEDALRQWSDPKIKVKISGSNNYMYGKHHTEEAKRKVSEANKGRMSWGRNKTPVICVELNKQFNDATDAGKILSLDGSAILKVCQGKRKTCGGYHWNFLKIGK